MDVHLRELAARQENLVAAWQLHALGWSRPRIRAVGEHAGWRVVHRGVYTLSQAPPSRRALWIAAVLTAPGTVLSHASAAACWGFRLWQGSFETVTRPGTGGPRKVGGPRTTTVPPPAPPAALLVHRSNALEGAVTRRDGIPITTAARTLIDLAPHLSTRQLGKAFREAIRLRTTTATDIAEALARHPGRRGTLPLADLVQRYATLPYARARSDAESRALERIRDAGARLPALNQGVGGEEADLVFEDQRLIVEIDGPQFHLFPEEDARKERAWRAAGYAVRRVSSDTVFADE